MKALLACLIAFAVIAPAAADTDGEHSAIAAAVNSPDRPMADTMRDEARKPAALIAFAGIRPGQRVADIMPGGGYFTRIFSKRVGPDGQVFAVIPAEFLAAKPTAADAVKAISAEPAFANVSVVVTPITAMTLPQPVDVAWTSQNYHDVYGFFGVDQAEAMDKAVFRMLRPGGIFMVIDHVALPGTSGTSPKTLHRIDPETVKAQALAAGFELEGTSDVLNNPADAHDKPVFDPSIKGRTDQFVMKFRKPEF